MRTSLEIAQAAVLRPVAEVAAELGLRPDEIEPHGRHAAKVDLAALRRLSSAPEGRLVAVTAVTPTPAGEGKTTTAIGLVDALRRVGARAVLTVRQPSLGPTRLHHLEEAEDVRIAETVFGRMIVKNDSATDRHHG